MALDGRPGRRVRRPADQRPAGSGLPSLPLIAILRSPTPARDYQRSLELGSAMTRVSYEQGGVHYRREMFVSAPAQGMVLHLSADHRAGALNFVAHPGRACRAGLAVLPPPGP